MNFIESYEILMFYTRSLVIPGILILCFWFWTTQSPESYQQLGFLLWISRAVMMNSNTHRAQVVAIQSIKIHNSL